MATVSAESSQEARRVRMKPMQRSRALLALISISIISAACGDKRETPADTGVVMMVPDSGDEADAGEPPDEGTTMDAEPADTGYGDPVYGDGGMDPEKCVFVEPPINHPQCRTVTNPKQHEEMCMPNQCDLGLVCLSLPNMGGPKCYGVCDLMTR